MKTVDIEFEIKEKWPQEPDGAQRRLDHVLDVFEGASPDGQMVVVATRNFYGKDTATGLTWGDLRALREALVMAEGHLPQPALGRFRQLLD